ncbi:SipW-dependent-type signal peptide-containing protein [Cellulomonas sp. RIT-PI-Y]|jgi:predicted ribosomally synthesized peptide with SipW-like signal peptide|uniref:SipW-dependent-type signal peptide-containing protein n=1 Tax=Cellulomonas sp. RIT-PI-Y TaxID=3035297 RepID=UPI0021D9D776|nr:SipW-dependent-type signal peptide-containing protein [Cellulomonas sp. RIT-PI-Y]
MRTDDASTITTVDHRDRRRRSGSRLRAGLAAAGVLGVGAAVTLAAWTDTEWIFGGADGDTPIGTSVFEVEQNVYDGESFQNRETAASAGRLDFTVAAASLSPGAVIYAPMQLRAAPGSIGGTAVLNGAVAGAGTSTELFDVLTYHVRSGVPQASCNDAGIAAGTGTEIVPVASALTANGTEGITILAAPDDTTGGTPVDLCFQITMPDTSTAATLQGQTVTPVWNVVTTSS